jgi:hypothetical protein
MILPEACQDTSQPGAVCQCKKVRFNEGSEGIANSIVFRTFSSTIRSFPNPRPAAKAVVPQRVWRGSDGGGGQAIGEKEPADAMVHGAPTAGRRLPRIGIFGQLLSPNDRGTAGILAGPWYRRRPRRPLGPPVSVPATRALPGAKYDVRLRHILEPVPIPNPY